MKRDRAAVWENPEEAFKELDAQEFQNIARSLAAYLRSLMAEGFTRREAIRLVEIFSKLAYEWILDDALDSKHFGSRPDAEDNTD